MQTTKDKEVDQYTLANMATSIIGSLLILLWVFTATSKIADFATFRSQMQTQPIPGWLSATLSWLLPCAELLIAWMLFNRKTQYIGLFLSVCALFCFTLYIGWMLISFHDLPCACGGPINGLNWWQHVLFNLFFSAIAVSGIVLHQKERRCAFKSK